MIDKVREFHHKYGAPVDAELGTDATLRLSLIDEELRELEAALANMDRVGIADALGDLLYVVVGAAVTWGIPLDLVFDEIHRSNMTKDGGTDARGKIKKGPGYSPPQLEAIVCPGR